MLSSEKIYLLESLQTQVQDWQKDNQKIVFTNGCFDILHLGHIDYLEKARAFGNKLVVGLNADASVKRLKGANRPINSEYARARLLAALQFVDAVVIFEEDTPKDLITQLAPDVLVKGSDYTVDKIVGADFVQARGGRVETVELVKDYSTTNIIGKIVAILCLFFAFTFTAFAQQDSTGKYKGRYKDGVKSGKGTYTWADGSTYEGNWRNDLPDGYGFFKSADNYTYAGFWRAGKKEGSGTYTWANGDLYRGGFKNDKKEGYGILVMKDGTSHDGEWKNDAANGQGTHLWTTGTKYTGEWKDNKRHGNGVLIYKNGNVEQGTWKDDAYVPCQCPQTKNAFDMLKEADGVFVGKVLSFINSYVETYAIIEVTHFWKGKLGADRKVSIKTGVSSCDLVFYVGESYLIYGKFNQLGGYQTTMCMGTKPLGQANNDLQELKEKIPCVIKEIASQNFINTGGYDICGCDGKTYRSPSDAAKNGITNWKAGECK